jgi:predicted  nucleic acid-binding Zn-ribbon protein
MPNRCVHCSAVYKDGSEEVLKGCSNCNGKFFFYISEEKLKMILEDKSEEIELNDIDKKQIERDVREIAGIEDINSPVVLDFESVKITKPGKYLLDISNLFSKKRPLVYKLEDGKYFIDISSKNNLA